MSYSWIALKLDIGTLLGHRRNSVKFGSFDQFSCFYFCEHFLPSIFFELKIVVLVSWTHITSVNVVRGYRFLKFL